jgi:hypothetical protein
MPFIINVHAARTVTAVHTDGPNCWARLGRAPGVIDTEIEGAGLGVWTAEASIVTRAERFDAKSG